MSESEHYGEPVSPSPKSGLRLLRMARWLSLLLALWLSAPSGALAQGGRELLGEARSAVAGLVEEERPAALLAIAEAQLDLGDVREARQTLAAAQPLLGDDETERGFALKRQYVALLARAGAHAEALQATAAFTDPDGRLGLLAAMGAAEAQGGKAEGVRDTIGAIDHLLEGVAEEDAPPRRHFHDAALSAIIAAEAGAGRMASAKEIVAHMTSGNGRAAALARIAMAEARRDGTGAAAQTLDAAEKEFDRAPTSGRRTALRALASANAALGRLPRAQMLLEMLLPDADTPTAGDDLVTALTSAGAWTEARRLAERLPPAARPDGLFVLADALRRAGQMAPAREALRAAIPLERQRNVVLAAGEPALLRLLRAQIEIGDRDGALAAIGQLPREERAPYIVAVVAAQQGLGKPGAADAIMLVERLLPELEGVEERVEILVRAGVAQAALGDRAAETAAFRRARQEATDGDGQLRHGDTVLARIARGEAEAGDFAAALATSREITAPPTRDVVLLLIVEAQAGAGEVAEALDTAARLSADRRSTALMRIARAQEMRGDAGAALATVRKIEDPGSRAAALIGLARGIGK